MRVKKRNGKKNGTMNLIDEEINKLLGKKITKFNKIVLFGANKSSMAIMEILQGYNIVAIIDNDIRKRGQILNNIFVYQPEEFLKDYDSSYRIIIASEYYAQMCMQLRDMGYIEGKEVFVVWHGQHIYNISYDTSDETFIFHIKKANNGFRIYRKIQAKYKDAFIFLCPYEGTGDIYLIGLYLKEYMKYNGIDNYIVTVPGAGCCKVIELFGINYINLSLQNTKDLLTYIRLMGYQRTKAYILNDCFYQTMVKRLRGYKGIDFHTMFQRCVFRLDNKVEKFQIKQINADEIFDKYGLYKGKTILLSPYANTIHKMPENFWYKLAEKLKKNGYCVCTNVSSENEKPIEGTNGIFIPYIQVIDFLNKAGGFVGMRSGLCDIVSSTTAKMVVLYPYGNIFGTCSTFDYFSLRKMKLKEHELLEIVFQENDGNNIENQIINFFNCQTK